jgi:hypothetical protein
MRTAIDDLSHVSASRMRAGGLIRPGDTTTTVAFAAGPSFLVGLQHVRFPNGAAGVFSSAPAAVAAGPFGFTRAGSPARAVWRPGVFVTGVEDLSRPDRAAHVASRLEPRLLSPSPARLKPHLRWSRLERRKRLEAALRRCEFVASRRDFRDLIGEG